MSSAVCNLNSSSWSMPIAGYRWLLCGALVAGSLVSLPAYAQEEPATERERLNQEHLQTMAKRVGRLSIQYANDSTQKPLQLLQAPVMRTGNKEGNPDGAVWLWLDGKQPIATLCVWNRGPLWYSENSALGGDAVEVTGWPMARWRSPASVRTWITLDDPVPESQAGRQRALRALALQFAAREDRMGIKAELRLLPRPLYTYSDPDHDVLDGALFAFVYGTDPEVFMQIEARNQSGGKRWQVSFARMASAKLAVQLMEKQVWSVEAIARASVVLLDAEYCIVRESQ